jgi:uncharacterized membrane protein YkoI
MIDKKILISIVIVLLIGVTAASYQITTKTPGIWQPSVSQAQTAVDQGSSGASSSAQTQTQPGSQSPLTTSSGQSGTVDASGQISADAAQAIAQNHDLEAKTVTGTPKLRNLDGTLVYIVPILDENNNQIGEIYVDAKTGNVTGGAGGAPNG